MAGIKFDVQLTQGAEDDLELIFNYVLESRSPDHAITLLEGFAKKIETLETFPQRGAVPREMESLGISEFRQILFPPYRVIYRIIDRTVFVSVIADGRRDFHALLERRLLGT